MISKLFQNYTMHERISLTTNRDRGDCMRSGNPRFTRITLFRLRFPEERKCVVCTQNDCYINITKYNERLREKKISGQCGRDSQFRAIRDEIGSG